MANFPNWFLNGISEAKKNKSEILWVRLVAPWADRSIISTPEQTDKAFFKLDLRADQYPEFNLEVQTFLKQVVSPEKLNWPIHAFFWVQNSKPLFLAPALSQDSLNSLLQDLLSAALVSGEELSLSFFQTLESAAQKDPLVCEQEFYDFENSVVVNNEKMRAAIQNPLLQGFVASTGSFGSELSIELFPAAYRALESLETEGARLKEMGLVQLLKTPLWDQLGGLFHRGFWKTENKLESEKLLIPNLEMLFEMKNEFLISKNTFIETCFYEGLKELLTLFRDTQGALCSAVSFDELPYQNSSFSFGASDLLEVLQGSERLLAQKFYGIQGYSVIPRIETTLQKLCQELNLPVVETHHKLIEIRKKLKSHRDLKQSKNLQKFKANSWQCLRAKSLLQKIARGLDDGLQSEIFEFITQFMSQEQSRNHSSLREIFFYSHIESASPELTKPRAQDFLERSPLSGELRWAVGDSEFSQSLLACYLHQHVEPLEQEKLLGGLINSPGTQRLKTLGLKGMGWMSYFLETQNRSKTITLEKDRN
jgi:hypothetical protein